MTVIVLGAGGFLGSNLVRLLRSRYEVVAVSRSAERTDRSAAFEDWTAVVDELRASASVAVVNTIAIADIAGCERDPVASERVNHILARDVGLACSTRNVPLVHISTDGLFGQGTLKSAPAYFGKHDRTTELNVYARSKRAAELALERLGWGHVLRLSFVGPDNGTGRGLVRFMADRVNDGSSKIAGYTDNWFTPVHVSDIALVVVELLDQGIGGFSLRHVASYPALTKYEYLQAVLASSESPIRVIPVERHAQTAASPIDQSLSAERPVALARVIELSVRDLRAMIADQRR